jgi:hypothetical protein
VADLASGAILVLGTFGNDAGLIDAPLITGAVPIKLAHPQYALTLSASLIG